jgi:hypothetical protein
VVCSGRKRPVVSLASVSTARRVWRVGGYSAAYATTDDPPHIRTISGQFCSADIEPPARLNFDTFGSPVSDRLRQVIRWWSRGLASEDPVDSLLSFGNALEQISNEVEGAPPQTRTCPECRHVVTVEPGHRQK